MILIDYIFAYSGWAREDDEALQADADLHQIGRHEELLGEIDKFHFGLYFDIAENGFVADFLRNHAGCLEGVYIEWF